MPLQNEEIYRFIKDRYDKAFTARQMWQTRLQHLLLFCGFFVTAVVSFLGPTTFGILADCDAYEEFVAASIAVVGLLALLLYLAFPIHRLLSVVANVNVYVADMDEDSFLGRMRYKGDVDINDTYAELGRGYLAATEDNTRFGADVGKTIRTTVFHLRILAILTLIVALIVGAIRVSVKSDWLSTGNKESTSMTDQESTTPSPSQTPAIPEPAPPATTPAEPSGPPPMRIKSVPVTGREDWPPTSIKAVDSSKGVD